MDVGRTAAALGCVLLLVVVVACGSDPPDSEFVAIGQKTFRDEDAGVYFRYPAPYSLIRRAGIPRSSGQYAVSLGWHDNGAGAFESLAAVLIGGWGAGHPALEAMTPLQRLQYAARQIRRDPKEWVNDREGPVHLKSCTITHYNNEPGLVTIATTRHSGRINWYYDYLCFRHDLLCSISVWGTPDQQGVTDAAALMTTTFEFDPPGD